MGADNSDPGIRCRKHRHDRDCAASPPAKAVV